MHTTNLVIGELIYLHVLKNSLNACFDTFKFNNSDTKRFVSNIPKFLLPSEFRKNWDLIHCTV